MKSEQDLPTLQEAFLGENKRIKAMIKDQNCVISFILECLLLLRYNFLKLYPQYRVAFS